MQCSFSIDKCSPECKKFGMCSLVYQERKLNNIQEQLASLFENLKFLYELTEKNRNELENKLNNYTKEILEIINSDSELN